MTEPNSHRADARSQVIDAAARLMREHGPAAVTTRGVAEAAGVQAPTIYRLFGDKDGLLDAVAEHVMIGYVETKAALGAAAVAADVDPLEDLRAGWQSQVDFGLANPDLFRLLSDPQRVRSSPAAVLGRQVLESRVHRIALSGRLATSERRAVELIQSAGVGIINTLLGQSPEERDPEMANTMFDAVLAPLLTPIHNPAQVPAGEPAREPHHPVGAMVAVRAVAPRLDMLTEAERLLLAEWLDRAIDRLGTG